MKVFHGTILTVDQNDSIASYLVVDGARIAFVGDSLPDQYAAAPVEELGKKVLVPAFVDTHEHFASFATFHAGLNVMDATSNAQIIEMVKDFAAKDKSPLLIAFGASPYSVKEGHLLSREELDSACPDRPMMVVKYDGHACIVNTPLLQKVDDQVKDLRGYHPDSGEMNQEAFFKVSDYMTAALPIPQLVKNMQKAMDYVVSKGIGMVHTVSGVGFPKDLDISMEKWVGRSAQHGFQLRVFPQSLDIDVALKRKLPRIGGCFACALDGCYGSQDAAMNEPYTQAATQAVEAGAPKGVLYYSDETVIDFCKKANRAGLQIEMHAIGDAAFDQATRCLAAALDDYPREDHRHGIIHACLPTKAGLEICAKYHIQLPMQTSFIGWPQEPDAYLEAIMGPDRANRLNPLRDFWDAGLVISAGSDAPCTYPDPILWMQRACNHSNPAQSLTPREALRMCTSHGAWTTFDEKERGSLEAGKIADMVVLSANPYEVPVETLGDIKVERTLLQGVDYQPQTRSMPSAILAGILSSARI
ncbi:MAG: amidohydrolase family protein [Coriobacteriales bacterium]|nr:amidohydrolase family protein [Coriobacteriales bacterium]